MNKIKTMLMVAVATLAGESYGVELSIYGENDGTFVKPNNSTDRHYTNGARIELAFTNKFEAIKEFGSNLPWMSETADPNCNFGLFIGQHMQTPDFIYDPSLRHNPEMRYAGWFYGGPFVQFADNMNMDHMEVSLGVIGPSAFAQETQDLIHDLRDLDKGVDWNNQMEDRFAGNFNWLHKFRIGSEEYYNRGPVYLEFLGETAVAAGTVHRNAGAGLTVRLGKDIPCDFGPASIARPKYYRIEKQETNTIYTFCRAAGSIVEHNELLDGLEKETFTGEIQAGVTWAWKKFTFSYSQIFMSRQYEKQEEADSYGSFILSWVF